MICVQVDVRLFCFNPNQSYWLVSLFFIRTDFIPPNIM